MKSSLSRLSTIFAAAALTSCAAAPAFAQQAAPSTITVVKSEVVVAPVAPKAEDAKKAELPPFPFTKLMLDETDGGKRIVRMEGDVTAKSAAAIEAQLIALDKADPGKPILLAINSPGGEVLSGLDIIDVMNSLQSPVYTVCFHECASMSGVLMVAGESGHRTVFPNADIMLHEVGAQGGIEGKISEQQTILENEIRYQDKLLTVLAAHSGQNKEDILSFINGKDRWLTPAIAEKLGFIDGVEQPTHPVVSPAHIEKLRTLQPA